MIVQSIYLSANARKGHSLGCKDQDLDSTI